MMIKLQKFSLNKNQKQTFQSNSKNQIVAKPQNSNYDIKLKKKKLSIKKTSNCVEKIQLWEKKTKLNHDKTVTILGQTS